MNCDRNPCGSLSRGDLMEGFFLKKIGIDNAVVTVFRVPQV